jgi:hypothetical protein
MELIRVIEFPGTEELIRINGERRFFLPYTFGKPLFLGIRSFSWGREAPYRGFFT